MKSSALIVLLLSTGAAAEVPTYRLTPRTRLLDVSADVLAPSEAQFGLFWLSYTHGVIDRPRLQVSAQFAAYLATLVNASAKLQVVDRPELRASIEAGAYWFALSRLVGSTIVSVPAAARATVPLADEVDLNLALHYRWLALTVPEVSQNSHDLGGEVTLVRYDANGAFTLQGKVPFFGAQHLHLDSLLGKSDVTGILVLDTVSSWSLMLARDQLFSDTGHIRFGLGYRRRPGLLLLESVGNVMLQFDVYWR